MLAENGFTFKGRGTGCEKIYQKDDIEIRLNRCKGIVIALKDGVEVVKHYISPYGYEQDMNTFIDKLNKL